MQNDAELLDKAVDTYLESDNLLSVKHMTTGGLHAMHLVRVSTDEERSWRNLADHSYMHTFAISQYAKVKDAVQSNRDMDAIRHFAVALTIRSILKLLNEVS